MSSTTILALPFSSPTFPSSFPLQTVTPTSNPSKSIQSFRITANPFPPLISLLCSPNPPSEQDALAQIASAHNLPSRDLIIVTVNDSRQTNVDTNTASGTHWSLLVYDIRANRAYCLDSLEPSLNGSVSHLLANRLSKMISARKPSFIQMKAPKQSNSYDCGMFPTPDINQASIAFPVFQRALHTFLFFHMCSQQHN